MRAKICIHAAFVAALLGTGPSDPLAALFGIGPAQAKDYYTRKRVNGRWITGRFPKRSTGIAKAPADTAQAAVAEAVPAPPPAAATRPQDVSTPAGPPSIQEQDRLLPLQRALEQRARSMAAREPRVGPDIKSVTYDFDKGRKTITFLDGTVTEEPLDPIATGQTDLRR
jgi:hypothetical protein